MAAAPDARSDAPGLVLAGGAVVYALALGPGGATFDLTPLLVGAIVVAAAYLGSRRDLLPTGCVLAGWGAAVMLVRHGPLPGEREAPAFLVGAGIGLVAVSLLARRRAVGGGGLALVVGGLGFYLAFDDPSLFNDWPLWTVVLAAWAAWELARSRWGGRRAAASLRRS